MLRPALLVTFVAAQFMAKDAGAPARAHVGLQARERLDLPCFYESVLSERRALAACARLEPKTAHVVFRLRWTVALDGSVVSVETLEGTASKAAKCAAKVIGALRYPPHREATAPFELTFKSSQLEDADEFHDTVSTDREPCFVIVDPDAGVSRPDAGPAVRATSPRRR